MKEEVENLSQSDKKLCQMLGSLEKVEAPKDFEFHLKARIANASPKAYQPGFARRYAYVMSVSTLAVALIVVGFYGNFSGTTDLSNTNTGSNNAFQPQPEQTQQAVVEPQPESTAPVVNTPVSQPKESVLAGSPKNEERRPEPVNTNQGAKRSQDRALSSANVLTPEGIKPDDKPFVSPRNLDKNEDFETREVFRTLGVETVLEKGVLKIKNVQPNSPAAKSGLKADDVIDTLDGKKVSGRSIRGTKIEVKKVGVKRGAETVEIDLQSKPQQ